MPILSVTYISQSKLHGIEAIAVFSIEEDWEIRKAVELNGMQALHSCLCHKRALRCWVFNHCGNVGCTRSGHL